MVKQVTIATSEDLRILRAVHRLTQAQMAQVMGTTQMAISYWERGAAPKDLYERIEAAKLVLEGKQPLPNKPVGAVQGRKDREMRETIDYLRQRAAESGCSLEQMMERRATQSPIRGHLTRKDIWLAREQLDFARANNLLK